MDTSPASPTHEHRTIPASAQRTFLLLLAVFWAYVASTNAMWGASMQAVLATLGLQHVFADWYIRLIQHLILFPALVATMWLSQRISWQPLLRAIPLQLICGIAFAALGGPAMDVSEALMGVYPWQDIRLPPLWRSDGQPLGAESYLWIASFIMVLINYAFALALLNGFEFYRRFRDSQSHTQALERSLSAAHLAALRMQLSPHTLFNLLHTIRGQVDWHPAVAQSMIVQLGDLLRRTLRAGEHELTPLQDELEFVRLYLQLQQRRFEHRMLLVVPPPDSAPAVWVPTLILLPLVENAVVHGLAAPQPKLTIRIEMVVDGETLTLRVSNSLPLNAVAGQSEQPGIGLKNVRERLAIHFAETGSCTSGYSAASDEWIAELRFPMLHSGA